MSSTFGPASAGRLRSILAALASVLVICGVSLAQPLSPAGWPEGRTPPFIQTSDESVASPRAILLESARFDTAGLDETALRAALPEALVAADALGGGWSLVQFDADVPDAERRALLASLGATIGAPVPANARLARLPAGSAETLRAQQGVLWVGRFHPALRLAPELAGMAPIEGLLHVRLSLAETHDPSTLRERIEALGGDVESAWNEGAYVGVPSVEAVLALARIEDVLYVEPDEQPALLNDASRGIVQSSEPGNDSVHLKGVRGESEIVAVMDSGIDTQHCCFNGAGKIVDNRAWGGGQLGALCGGDHGTHVSGTVACANGGDRDGVAPDAQIILQDVQSGSSFACLFGSVSPPSPLSSAWSDARSRGAFIHTNSWGGGGNSYGGSARSIDQFMWENQDFLILYAAGNSGSRVGSLGSYSNAKNSITVGGTQNGAGLESMYSASSRGPAGDGRLLPDLTAPAQGVSSARNRSTPSCGWTTYSGTSMATPAVAGSAALVREYFTQGWYPSGTESPFDAFTPSAALVKATLLLSTRNMTGTGTRGDRPNADQGFGRVTLDDALWFEGDAAQERLFVLDDRSTSTGFTAAGQEQTFTLDLNANRALKVVLTWTDAPAAAGSAKALVNDLDLEVTTANGLTYVGNQGFEGGWTRLAGGDPDRLNNKETVMLEGAYPGPVTITVRAHAIGDVALQAQDFALAAVASSDPDCGEAPATGPGNTLIVSRGASDVALEWADTGAPGHSVFRGTTPDFLTRGVDPFAENVQDGDLSLPGVQWADPGAMTDGQSYFYVSFAANGCGELVP